MPLCYLIEQRVLLLRALLPLHGKISARGEAEKILKENYRVIKKVAPDSACVKTMEKLLSKCGTF
jgi:hypothetical protein